LWIWPSFHTLWRSNYKTNMFHSKLRDSMVTTSATQSEDCGFKSRPGWHGYSLQKGDLNWLAEFGALVAAIKDCVCQSWLYSSLVPNFLSPLKKKFFLVDKNFSRQVWANFWPKLVLQDLWFGSRSEENYKCCSEMHYASI